MREDKTEEQRLEMLVNQYRTTRDQVQRCAVTRHIFDEARKLHRERLTFQARSETSERNLELAHVVWTEVVTDVRTATRRWLAAMKMVRHMQDGAADKFARRALTAESAREKLMKVKPKICAVEKVCELFTASKDRSSAETMWQALRAGIASSPNTPTVEAQLSTTSKASQRTPSRLARLFVGGDEAPDIGPSFSLRSRGSNTSLSPSTRGEACTPGTSTRRNRLSLPHCILSPRAAVTPPRVYASAAALFSPPFVAAATPAAAAALEKVA